MEAATEVRKKILGVKVDQVMRDRVELRCDGLGCTFSDYVRDLITKDLDSDNDSNSSGFIAHNGNPSIKLVKALGDGYYLDANGVKWFMMKDGTLAGVATSVRISQDNEVLKPDGSVDVYKNAKLDHTRHPPKEPGGRWTYTLYV